MKYDKDWIDFIVKSRITGAESEYDIIYDRIADNTYNSISETLLKYSNNEVSHQKAIEIIQFKRNDVDQYCFKTQMALSLLVKEETVVLNYIDGKWIQER